MRPVLTDLTADRIRQVLNYDPDTGIFAWRARNLPTTRRPNSRGYIKLTVDKHQYQAHRLAWLYMTGEFPAADLDHVNRDWADNRWTNLRAATRSLNCANRPLKVGSSSGFKGVCRHYDKWTAQIKVDGKTHYLGDFATPERAFAVYVLAAKNYFGAFAKWDVANLASLDRVVRELEDVVAHMSAE